MGPAHLAVPYVCGDHLLDILQRPAGTGWPNAWLPATKPASHERPAAAQSDRGAN